MSDNGLGTDLTIQSTVRSDVENYGLDILPFLVKAGDLIPPWWSRKRDDELSRFWKQSDHVSGAIAMFTTKTASVPVMVEATDPNVKLYRSQARFLTALINNGSDFGGGWASVLCPKATESYLTQDNGFFLEIIGQGDPNGALEGLPVGIAHLDSSRCQRQSNAEYPVIYTDIDGRRYRLHRTRVAFVASQPSPRRTMNGVGFCAMSRMVNTAQHLIDIGITEQEYMGSRPKRQIIIGRKGITAQEIASAFATADVTMDNQGLRRYSKNVVIAPRDRRNAEEIIMEIMNLATPITGADKETSITLGMFAIALALNIPPRWIWPATQAGATKADAMFSHIAGMGGGIGLLLETYTTILERAINGAFIRLGQEPRFKVIFDFQDDEQDRNQAEIRKIRSDTRTADLTTGAIDLRTARQQMLAAGDITEQQFDDMELESGRLPDGSNVLNLFMSGDTEMQPLLALSVGDVLNPADNDREFVLGRIDEQELQVRAVMANPPRPRMFDKAKQALAALAALRKLYEKPQRATEPPAQMAHPEPMATEEPPVDVTMTDETAKELKSYIYNGVTVQASRRRPSTRDDKKYMRTVRKDGKDYVVHYGDPNMPMQRDVPERRANFLSRHNCSSKKDPLAPGFWACLDWDRTGED